MADPKSSSPCTTASPPSPSPPLRQAILSLPQELIDLIIDHVFHIPQNQIIMVQYTYTPPATLNVSKAIRRELWPRYFGNNQFCLEAQGDLWDMYRRWTRCKSFFPEGYVECGDEGQSAEGWGREGKGRRISQVVAEVQAEWQAVETSPGRWEVGPGSDEDIVLKCRSGVTPWITVYYGNR